MIPVLSFIAGFLAGIAALAGFVEYGLRHWS